MVILIADDDRLVRFSIKSMLGEILGDSGDIFIEAANGRDMVKLCQERKPDVVFVPCVCSFWLDPWQHILLPEIKADGIRLSRALSWAENSTDRGRLKNLGVDKSKMK